MPKIQQKMKKSLVQGTLNQFSDWFHVPKNPISRTRSITSVYNFLNQRSLLKKWMKHHHDFQKTSSSFIWIQRSPWNSKAYTVRFSVELAEDIKDEILRDYYCNQKLFWGSSPPPPPSPISLSNPTCIPIRWRFMNQFFSSNSQWSF